MSLACDEHERSGVGYCGWCDACQAVASEPYDQDAARLRKRRGLIARRVRVLAESRRGA